MLEVEYKAAVADLAAVARTLDTLGAKRDAPVKESDVYYAHPVRDFATTDEALRIRTTAGGQVLTYKGPREPGATRAREEVEASVDGELARMLEALSFRPAGTVRKTRVLYRLGELAVTLDEVQGLGAFVEVERVVHGPDDLADARAQVLALARRLGLGPEERRSYLEMVMSHSP